MIITISMLQYQLFITCTDKQITCLFEHVIQGFDRYRVTCFGESWQTDAFNL